MKSRLTIILSVACALLLVVSLKSCFDAYKSGKSRDKEMYNRLEVEEKLSKFSSEKSSIEEKIKSLSDDLAREKQDHQVTKTALQQEQLINQSLKDELAKITKLKEALEAELKEALSKIKSSGKK